MLAGLVRLDGRYALEVAAGRILSNNGAQAISLFDRLDVGVIANHGGALRDLQGKALWGLLAGDEAGRATGPVVAAGELLPVAGMGVQAIDPLTGRPVALGQTGEGQPIYEVTTDAEGRWRVFLPRLDRPLLVLARVPGVADQRLTAMTCVGATAADAPVDEDTATATQAVRRAVANVWLQMVQPGAFPQPPTVVLEGRPAGPEVQQRVQAFHAFAVGSGASQLDATAREALAGRLADIELAYSDPTRVRVGRMYRWGAYDGPEETAFEAYVEALRITRTQLLAKLREVEAAGEDPIAFLNGRPYLVKANEGRAAPYVIKKIADFQWFIFDHYVLSGGASSQSLMGALQEVAADMGGDVSAVKRFIAAYDANLDANVRSKFVEDTDQLERMKEAISDAVRDATASSGAASVGGAP